MQPLTNMFVRYKWIFYLGRRNVVFLHMSICRGNFLFLWLFTEVEKKRKVTYFLRAAGIPTTSRARSSSGAATTATFAPKSGSSTLQQKWPATIFHELKLNLDLKILRRVNARGNAYMLGIYGHWKARRKNSKFWLRFREIKCILSPLLPKQFSSSF